jgi:hypothetical protein
LSAVCLAEDLNSGQIDIDLNMPTGDQTLSVPLCEALSFIGVGCPLKKTDNGMMNVSLGIPPDSPVVYYSDLTALMVNNFLILGELYWKGHNQR